MFVNDSAKRKICTSEKDSKTEEVETLIHYSEIEPILSNIIRSALAISVVSVLQETVMGLW